MGKGRDVLRSAGTESGIGIVAWRGAIGGWRVCWDWGRSGDGGGIAGTGEVKAAAIS
jgi:hypothetical protein